MKLNPFVVASLSLVFAIAACGSDNSGGTGTGSGGSDSSGKGGSDSSGKGGSSSTGKGGSSTSTGSFSCCLNGNGFACKNDAALEACFSEGDTSNCTSDANACESSGKGGTGGTSSSGKGGTGGSGGTGSTSKKEIGKQCTENDECVGEACLKDSGADFGFCSNTCEDFSDCPSFWTCEKVGNATSKYCVQNQ